MAVKTPIYLDNNATTPLDPRVLNAMMPYFTTHFGNAGSRNHSFGWDAEEAVDQARDKIAKAIGARTPSEIIFTSGATESNNLAIRGVAEMHGKKGKHIITESIEHKAVLDPCHYLAEKHGFEITFLDVDKLGRINLEALKNAIRPDTILISIMAANNEIGNINPIEEIGRLAHEKNILFHTDATQAVGKTPIDVEAMHVDLLSMSGHKLYGPKGVGALYVRKRNPRVLISPILYGGGQERDLRSGTLNVPGIVGMGAAVEIAVQEMESDTKRLREMRDIMEESLFKGLDFVYVNGDKEHRLPGVLNISFAYVEGEALMMGFNELAVSSGSACTSASLEPSYVLRALGIGDDLAHSSIRFSLGRFNTMDEIKFATERVVDTVKRLREMSPLYEMALEGIDISKVQWNTH